MIFAPPTRGARRAGCAARACVSSRACGVGGLFAPGRDHQYWRHSQFKFYRAGRGTDCLRHRSRQWVARRFDVKAPWRRFRPGRRDCFQRQDRWRGFKRTSRASFFPGPAAEIARPERFFGHCCREPPDRRRGGDAHRLHRGQHRGRAAAVAVASLVGDCLRRRRAQQNLAAGIGGPAALPRRLAETFGWSSDAMEAQAFAYLAARREKNLPITFPMTTGVEKPLEGGVIAEPGVA
jgi:hypothetical protein